MPTYFQTGRSPAGSRLAVNSGQIRIAIPRPLLAAAEGHRLNLTIAKRDGEYRKPPHWRPVCSRQGCAPIIGLIWTFIPYPERQSRFPLPYCAYSGLL
jgi:hypothetical protein